jgi:thiol-disulfide isomerase/thioredoxin
MRHLSGWALVALGCAFLVTGCAKLNFWRRPDPAQTAQGPGVGTAAPQIEGIDFEGKPLKLSEYRGKVVVVAFWASWCGHCHPLIPKERALADRYRERRFALIGVNLDENPEEARRIISSKNITWRCCQTGGWKNPMMAPWNISSIPALFVIDAQGVIRQAHTGGVDEASLHCVIEQLLAETEKNRAG